MTMTDWATQLFTLTHLGAFLFGVTAATAWHAIKARVQHRVLIIHWQYIAVPLVIGIALYLAQETQRSADCVREFQQVLRERSSVTTQNDQISIEQRELIYEWMHNLVFPPPDIARLDEGDPARKEYLQLLTEVTDERFAELIAKQREFERVRSENPLPAPRCGL